ncbi:MAG: ABC transporter permease [Nitrospira sp. SB0678_bin_10]|nr:ABC transporter permease [Nitrospira sp. SB0678_bin_10]
MTEVLIWSSYTLPQLDFRRQHFLERIFLFGTLAFKHLTSRPFRTTLTVVGVAVGVAAVLAIYLANQTVFESFQRAVTRVVGEATIHISGAERRLDETLIERIRRHPDVQAVHPYLSQSVTLESADGDTRAGMVWGLDLLDVLGRETGMRQASGDEEFSLDPLLSPETIFVDRELASGLGVSRGDPVTVHVGPHHFETTVSQVLAFSDDEIRWDFMAVMDIAAAQVQLNRLGQLDGVDVVTAPGVSVDRVIRELQGQLGPSVLVNRPSQRDAQVQRMLTSFQLNLTTLSMVGLFVGTFLIYNAVGFSVVQYRREIGILRAIGMVRGHVALLFLGEAIIVGIAGGGLGSVLGSGLAHWLVGLERETVSELYGIATFGELPFTLPVLLGGGLLGMVLSVIGALGPCLEASRTSPALAIAPGQYETARHHHGRWTFLAVMVLGLAGLLSLPGPVNGLPVFGYAAAFCVLLGCTLLSPLGIHLLGLAASARSRRNPGRFGIERRGDLSGTGLKAGSMTRLAVDQIARSSGRNSVTLSAFMVGIAIVVGVGVMIESFRDTVERWIDQTLMADLVVTPHEKGLDADAHDNVFRISPEMVRLAGEVPGVAAVDPYRQMRMQVGSTQVYLAARDLALHAERSRYLFVDGDSSRRLRQAIAERGVVVSEVLARRLGVNVGDVLSLPTGAGQKEFPVAGIFYDYATDGGKIVLDRSLYERWWGDRTSTVLAVYLEPNASASRVRGDLKKALGPLIPVSVVSNTELRTHILEIFDRTFRLTYGLELVTVIVGLLGIINTLLTTVVERQREFATFRAIGGSRRQVRGLVVRESLCLGFLGLGLGLLAGVLLATLLISVINKQSFGWTIHMTVPSKTILEAFLVAGFTGLLAGYLPARWATHGAIADGLRYE